MVGVLGDMVTKVILYLLFYTSYKRPSLLLPLLLLQSLPAS